MLALAKMQRGVYSPYADRKRKIEADIGYCIRAQGLKPAPAIPIKLEFDWFCRNRRIDPDNIRSGAKFIIDALVKNGILAGDGWESIGSLVDRFHHNPLKTKTIITF